MNFDKLSPFDGFKPPQFSAIFTFIFFIGLEVAMFIMFYAVYTETIGLMNKSYLSELPVIGGLFKAIDPDANASHIISMLLAIFSVGTPIFIWGEVFRHNILDDPREWISHPQNKVIASFAFLVLALVISLEVINLYTLIARETAPSGFVTNTQASGVMALLAQNKALAIGVSLVIAIINIILALFSVRALRSLKSSEGDNE